jgi:hypothetical protein
MEETSRGSETVGGEGEGGGGSVEEERDHLRRNSAMKFFFGSLHERNCKERWA